jgi:hypothetical protein
MDEDRDSSVCKRKPSYVVFCGMFNDAFSIETIRWHGQDDQWVNGEGF